MAITCEPFDTFPICTTHKPALCIIGEEKDMVLVRLLQIFLITDNRQCCAHGTRNLSVFPIVDVRVAYIRKLAILGDRDHIVTANYSPVLCSYLWGPLDLNP